MTQVLSCEFCKISKYRSSHRGCSIKKGVLENFAKLTGKHLCQSLFFNKVVGLRPPTLFKKILAQVFSCEFYEISKNTFFYRTLPVAVSADSIRFPFLPKKQTGLTSWNFYFSGKSIELLQTGLASLTAWYKFFYRIC